MIVLKKLLFITSILVSYLDASPKWYIQNNIPSKSYEVIGYGTGDTKEEAEQNAKANISKTISSQVSSSSIMNKTSDQDSYSKSFISKSEIKSNVILDGVSIIKSDKVDDKFFVALKYINLPFANKVALDFPNSSLLSKEKNEYLKSTILLDELKNEFGFYPKVTIYNGKLTIGNRTYHINKTMLGKLFASKSNKNVKLNVPKLLKNEDFYFIGVESKNKGYLTLVQIYENGETSILLDNKELNKHSKIEFPNRDEYDGLQAYLSIDQDKAKDLTIAMICRQEKDFSYFDNISTNKEKYAKVYGKMFDMLKNCDLHSSVTKIRK